MASKATDKRDFEEAKQTEDPNQPDAADTISSVLHECENLRLQIIQMVRKYPISVTSALLGWTGLLVLNALAEVCTASPDEMDMCLDWKSYWTLALLLGALLLMMNDAAPDLVMLGFTVVLVLSKVINDSEAWAGCRPSLEGSSSLHLYSWIVWWVQSSRSDRRGAWQVRRGRQRQRLHVRAVEHLQITQH